MLKLLKSKTMKTLNNYNVEEYFDLLPDEIVIFMLSFVDVDALLNCRLVCKRWRSFIDAYVFQEKVSRENKFVNNGKGYYSFSQINSNSIGKLDYPWFVFYAIYKYDPFHRNLVQNHCGQDKFNHWILTSDRNLWIVEETPQGTGPLPNDPDFDGHTCCFASTFRLCSKQQTIALKKHGLTSTVMKLLKPNILFSEWFSGRFDCGCRYGLVVTSYDDSKKALEEHTYEKVLEQWTANIWIKVSHLFKNQSNASSIFIYHTGVDTQYWRGHYGTKISGTVVKVMLPIKFKCAESSTNI